jgi:hypothetical protein
LLVALGRLPRRRKGGIALFSILGPGLFRPSLQRILPAGRTDPATVAQAVEEQRSVAAAAVPDLKLFPLGERAHESNELVHRKARLWSDQAVDLEDSTETLGPLDT